MNKEFELEALKQKLPFTYAVTRVHKKEVAGLNKVFLIVKIKGGDAKNEWLEYSSYIKIPTRLSDEQLEESAREMYKGLVKKYKLKEK